MMNCRGLQPYVGPDLLIRLMDCRVKPGNDGEEVYAGWKASD
jgi:hypothetical protein